MTATTNLHSAATRGDELHELAVQLYGLISSGHDALAFSVDARGPALTIVDAGGKRRLVRTGGGEGGAAPAWQRARELRDGAEVDRRFNAWILAQHLRGRYSVAPASAGWVQWVALDIDAHPAAGVPELVARRLAKARADRVLADVWRALNCSAERHPLVLRSPGGGYHVWFPLTRGPSSSNAEHTWPAAVARAWFERHLLAAGLELAPGVLEVFPSGRCFRAPCGSGMQLLQATRPDDPDALGLMPWPGTMGTAERVDWRGERATLSSPVRRVVPMVTAFVGQWDSQRRTLAEWLGRSEASWDPAWGFLGWRTDDDAAPATEKKTGAASAIEECRSQESDDVLRRPWAGGLRAASGVPREQRRERSRSSPGSISREKTLSSAPEVDLPPDSAGGPLVRGLAFKKKVRRLLAGGITEPGTRHDAVLTLAFYWGATCGLGEGDALARLEAWCGAHAHLGSQLAARPRVFRDECLREAQHYLRHYAARWRFRGTGDGGGLATLSAAEEIVIAAVDPRVRDEVAAILAWLAARADEAGRLGAPIQISAGLLARLCGDRRVVEDGKRRRATALALGELERLGVLTMASNYRVGQRGRVWSCWYRFGSGELPRTVALGAAAWAALDPQRAVAPSPTLAIAAVPEAPADAASSPPVIVRVVGERVVPEGLLRVMSDGARGAPRTLLTLAADVAPPTVTPSIRAPWFVRPFQRASFTPASLASAQVATVIPFPDVEARRRMTRRERLAVGGGLAPVIPLRAAAASARGAQQPPPARGGADPPETSSSSSPHSESGDQSAAAALVAPGPAGDQLRAELAAEVGDAAEAIPLDLIDVVAHAWRAFRGRDPK